MLSSADRHFLLEIARLGQANMLGETRDAADRDVVDEARRVLLEEVKEIDNQRGADRGAKKRKSRRQS